MICQRIKAVRKALNLTQAEFADRLGAKRSTVAGWDRGLHAPSDTILVLICKTFNVDPEWLRTGSGEMFIEIDHYQLLGEKVGRVLALPDNDPRRITLEFILDLPPECWQTVLDYAIRLSKSSLPNDL